MKTKPITICLALVALLFTACTKIDVYPDTALGKQLSGGGQGGTSATPTNSDSYLPVTKNSTWTYAINMSGSKYTTTVTMTGKTTAINGKTYYDASSVSSIPNSTGTGYFYAAAHTYTTRASTLVQNATVEMPFLIDNVAVGATWTAKVNDSGIINGVAGQFVGTLKESNISKTVNGKVYQNVIHTQIDLQYDVLGSFQSFGVYDYYLAKGVGIIKLDFTSFGILVSQEDLTSYSIK